MRDKWSLHVTVISNEGFVSQQVLDFGSPSWADTAFNNLRKEFVAGNGRLIVIKLY